MNFHFRLLWGCLLALLVPALAWSHPHVFMDYKTTLVCNDHGIESIQVSWVYDEMYSQTRWEAFDSNRNGQLEPGELAEMTRNERDLFEHDGSFTWIKLDGKKIKTSPPRDFSTRMIGKRLAVSFTVDCLVPVGNKPRELRISIYDPSYFYELTSQDDPVQVSGNTRFDIHGEMVENRQETFYFGQLHPLELIFHIAPSPTPRFTFLANAAPTGVPGASPDTSWTDLSADNPLPGDSSSAPVIQDTAKPVATAREHHSGSVLLQLALWQKQLKSRMSDLVDNTRKDHSVHATLLLLTFAFAYGIIHAAGPGHGKVITVSYLLSSETKLSSGLILGNLIALFHGLSGMLLVMIAHFIMRYRNMNVDVISRRIETVSYGLIVLIGLWLLLRSIENKGCSCGLHDHSHGDHDAPHHDHETEAATSRKPILALAFSAGIVPCPGTMLIMIFCMAAGVTLLGIWMALFETAGMAMTISAIGTLALWGKKAVTAENGWSQKLEYFFSAAGAVLIMIIGTALLLASLV